MLLAAQEGEWDELDAAIVRFQQANMAIKYAPVPVVAAPFAMTLGGGCEVVLHAARAQASAETYMGLVEAGVGLIPAAGGCKEMLLRTGDAKKAFELIGYAKVSSSAAEARELRPAAPAGLHLHEPGAAGGGCQGAWRWRSRPRGRPARPRQDIRVEGESGYALLKMGVYMAREGEYISGLRRGDRRKAGLRVERRPPDRASRPSREQYLLDLEREAFLSLCGKPQDAGAHAAHAEDREAVEELTADSRRMPEFSMRKPSSSIVCAPPSAKRRAARCAIARPDDLAAAVIRRAAGEVPAGARRTKSTT